MFIANEDHPMFAAHDVDTDRCPACDCFECSSGCPLAPIPFDEEQRIVDAMLASFPVDMTVEVFVSSVVWVVGEE